VEPRQDFRHDRRRSLSLRHAGREQAGTLPPSSGGCRTIEQHAFSTLSHHEETKDAKARDGDVVELQLAHLDNSTVEGLYKKPGPLPLGSRTKLMQHWADRIDHWLDPKKVMPIKGGAQG
jgi:hypothetical protein